MADSSEFVILLDQPSDEIENPRSEEFVYLLDNEPAEKDDSEKETGTCLTLPSNSTIDSVMALYQDLAELDASSDACLILDASAVTDSDTAVLQLLSSFVVNSDRNGTAIAWYQPTPYFCDLAKQLDYAKYLKLDSLVESL
ncbi:STAS domain-containing protein [Zhongshania arctica]|uniref:STAS domain-containing protein n=1 Tax=Zhongshania arctica TaxID=3238302 RepID=A0ABV3TUQ7_9GAMM|tara:strand:+ start:9575 stop:9997 length:423 start_codon:yes stop_codon:yes gene_type:complete